jgi:outer membrane protein OmpA-like peptidoglycan-associated protein
VNKVDCEGNARRNGWTHDVLSQQGIDNMAQKELNDEQKELNEEQKELNEEQKELNEEQKEIRSKAYALYKERGFKDGNDFVLWLEAERQAGEKSRLRSNRQLKNILWTIAGILCVIVAILLIMMFTKKPPVELSKQSLSELKIMMLVFDPKEDEKVIVFGDTHFEYDKFTLSQEAKALLDKDVQSLKENPSMHVRMAGYTSAEGTETINQELSEKRANAVRDYLIEKGIAPERITVIGYGRTRPAVYEVTPGDINSKEARANMRVLFEVVVK